MKAASRLTVSPSGFVSVRRWGPGLVAGVTSARVFASIRVTVAFFPARVAVVPVWKLLPRTVMVVPPAAGAFAGEIVPIPSGTFASWITVRPELVMAKMRWPVSSMVTNWARRLLVSAEMRGDRFW